MNDNRNAQTQMEGLATLLVLDNDIKKITNLREFGFFTTNETHRLIPYHTGFLWQKKDVGGVSLLAQSGTAELDIHAPINQWLKSVISAWLSTSNANKIHAFDLTNNEASIENIVFDEAIAWTEVLPGYVLWCPFFTHDNQVNGGLILFREKPFEEAEIKMTAWLIDSYQYTWLVLTRPKFGASLQRWKEKHLFLATAIIVLAVLLFPMRLSVLGNATVISKDPMLINAPLQGVIKSFAVSPGQTVKKGQLLLTMDKADLLSDAEIRQKEYQLTEARLRTAINAGFDKADNRAEIPILQAQLKIDKAKIDYTNEMLAKTEIKSPINGVVIFDSKEDWVGQPVQTGERILSVADPQSVQLKIMIPVSNIIKLEIGAPGEFFLFGQLTSMPIKIITLGYNAKLMPSRVLAYKLEATFTDFRDKPQLGSEGTARVYGRRVPMIYYLLRRPLQSIRQSMGI